MRAQPSGQRREGVGQSKHGRVEFVCDMERVCGGIAMIVWRGGGRVGERKAEVVTCAGCRRSCGSGPN